MGKKTRKTRWRTLPIADESDSEESNTLSGSHHHHQIAKNYHHRPFYSKFTYSSQSTPTKRYQYEPKSTRSSSTASENKITFNEDEYTKITTPRQDVLFKKGYLSKPKNYQTQTSTGNSTASTGNSTGNGTPDHQSADGAEGTDLEYESQFVFPNAFVDHNGIYYINNETTSSEDGYSSDEAVTQIGNRLQAPKKTISYRVDESTPTVETVTSSHKLDEECPAQNTESQTENIQEETPQVTISLKETDVAQDNSRIIEEAQSQNGIEVEQLKEVKLEGEEHQKTVPEETTSTDKTNKSELALDQNQENPENNQTPTQESINTNPEQTQTNTNEGVENLVKESKFNLNAEEFVQRAYRPMELIPVDPNLQFINIHPNFVPLPLINHPLNELNPPLHFNPPFLPPGIPLNFIPGDPKLLPNFVNFVPSHFVQHTKNFEQTQTAKVEECKDKNDAPDGKSVDDRTRVDSIGEEKPEEKPVEVVEIEKVENNEKTINCVYKTDVDIAKIVSKLEEAAKEQKFYENRRQNYSSPSKFNKTPRQRYNSPYQNEYRQDSYKPYYDKRKPKRLETPATSSSDANRSETTSSNKTTPVNDGKTLNQTI
ncbi:hypothetical protein QE152_g23290 [Popillia japonica]|uniref:Uncharacterized protein n=1 Tax=Popillia japonica TaxID=7064 RepID=A0AAW1KHK8_POPJA